MTRTSNITNHVINNDDEDMDVAVEVVLPDGSTYAQRGRLNFAASQIDPKLGTLQLISNRNVQKIYSECFAASQLDSNTQALFATKFGYFVLQIHCLRWLLKNG